MILLQMAQSVDEAADSLWRDPGGHFAILTAENRTGKTDPHMYTQVSYALDKSDSLCTLARAQLCVYVCVQFRLRSITWGFR